MIPSAWQRYHLVILSLLSVAAAWFFYHHYFIQDDAYISFVYARNFADGNGLVWYPGSDEYGYTNFLHTLLIGCLLKLGLTAEVASYLISVPSMLAALVLTYFLALRVSTLTVALITVGALVTHQTIAAYATGGLETSLQLALIIGVYLLVVRWHQEARPRDLIKIAVLSALALLVRLDSALLLFPAYVFLAAEMLARVWNKSMPMAEASKKMALAVLPPTLAVAGLLIFTHFYYGYMLPSSYEAKITAGRGWFLMGGLNYLTSYLKAQAYMPMLLLLFWFVLMSKHDFVWREVRYRALLLAPILLWLVYTFRVGGDFMEFRFFVPILPFFYLLIVDTLLHLKAYRPWMLLAVVGMIGLGNLMHRYYFTKSMDDVFVESTPALHYWIVGQPNNWVKTGKALHEMFYTGQPDDVRIAVTAAGAITYYSKLNIFDEFGLNTRKVFQGGGDPWLITRPGHRLRAHREFMLKEGVNLIVDHPVYLRKEENKLYCEKQPVLINQKLLNIPAVFLSLDNNYYLLAYYLQPHPVVERMIWERKILQYNQIAKNVLCRPGFVVPGDPGLLEEDRK